MNLPVALGRRQFSPASSLSLDVAHRSLAAQGESGQRRFHHGKIRGSDRCHSGPMERRITGNPTETRPIEQVLSDDFAGCSFAPAESRLVRSGPPLEVRHNKFLARPLWRKDAFLQDMRSAMSTFSQILTAEFQVVAIDASPALHVPNRLRTRVRYESWARAKASTANSALGNGTSSGKQPPREVTFACKAGWRWMKPAAVPRADFCRHHDRGARPAILLIRLSFSTAPTIGALCSTSRAASIFMATTAFPSATLTMTASMISTFANPPAFPTGCIEIAATARSKTSPKHPESACLKIPRARFLPTSTTTAART